MWGQPARARVLWSERRCSLGTAVAPCSHAKPSSSPQTTTASGRPRAGFSCRAGGLAGRSKSSRHQAGSSPTFLPRARPKAGQQGRHGHSAGRHALTRAGRHGTSAQQPACHATLDGDRKSEAGGAACCSARATRTVPLERRQHASKFRAVPSLSFEFETEKLYRTTLCARTQLSRHYPGIAPVCRLHAAQLQGLSLVPGGRLFSLSPACLAVAY